MKSLKKAAEARGHSIWGRGPDDTGSYNSKPHETGFFRDGGEYDGYYGRFFLKWYSSVLIDHADQVLTLANLAFEGTHIAAKVSETFHSLLDTKKKKNLQSKRAFSDFKCFDWRVAIRHSLVV